MNRRGILKHYKNLSFKLKTKLKDRYSKGLFTDISPVEDSKGVRTFCVYLGTGEVSYLIKLDEWQYTKSRSKHLSLLHEKTANKTKSSISFN